MENMEMNEIMDVEVMEMTSEPSGLSTGKAMLVGAALTAATVAAIGLGKKLWAKYKASKETQSRNDVVYDENVD